MTFAPGSKFGPYEILAPLGAGGMGEVYRARDTKLHRDVALKILPEAFVNDPARLSRFRREAQTLASLNHPNIAQIYGLEESTGVLALAMEFVEGEELTQRIAIGPVPLEDAVPMARQIAEGLESAHERGVVHRDLKPANIKLTSTGQIKLLDFGLATALSGDASLTSSPDVSKSPTQTRMTEEGMILGTAAYMSPEQARGKKVDKRADIWAFGVILFGMLSGKKLFSGETVSDTLASVLRQEIHWNELPPDTPIAIRQLLQRCLERDPNLRLRDIGEARVVLSTFKEIEPPAKEKKRSTMMYWILLPLLVAAAFLAGRFGFPVRSAATKSETFPFAKSFTLLTDQPGVESQPSLSPDGRSLAFVKDNNGQQDIYLVRVGGRNAVNLTPDSTGNDISPAFSPDGESIAFRSDRSGGGIFIMGSTGESVRRVTDVGYTPAWSPDGKRLVVSNVGFIFPQDRQRLGFLSIIDIATGEKRAITPVDADAIQPNWSPNGKRIAYWGLRANSGRRDIWTVAEDGSESKSGGVAVTDDPVLDWSPVWSPDGKFLYFSSNRSGTLNLWRVPMDENTGKTLGEPQPITVPSGWAGNPSFSRDGKLAFSSLEWRSRLLRLSFDPATGKASDTPVSILASSYPMRDHSVSPDGKWIAYNAFVGGKEDLFLVRMDGTELRRLTDDVHRDRGPIWQPDGERIAFYSDRSGAYEIWTIRPEGSGLERLTQDGRITNIPVFSPDGKQIAGVYIGQGSGGWGILQASKTPPPPAPLLAEPAPNVNFWPFSWSPDGKKLVGTVLDKGGSVRGMAEYLLADSRFENLPDTKITGVWACMIWLSDSQRFIYRDPRGLSLYDTRTKTSELIYPVAGYYIARSVGITPDDRSITLTETGTEGDIWLAEFNTINTVP